MKRILLSVFLIIPCTFAFAQPNFVLILVDDMGWNGTSVEQLTTESGSRSDYYQTPNLERIAAMGMTFSQGYAPAPKCSPSRNSILTGQSTARNQFTTTAGGIEAGKPLLEASTKTAIDMSDITIGEWLKSTGMNYTTAHFGKWHIKSNGPANNGFDEGDGTTANNEGDTGVGLVQDDPKRIFELSNKAIAFMQSAKANDQPFYLQISHYAVHSQVEARQETINLYNDPNQRPVGTVHSDPPYAAMTEDLDTGIGMVLDEIERLDLDSNTYIIFLSDNGGPMNLTSNAPLNWGKTFIYEGGIRVPFMVSGPGIAAASRSDVPVVGYDLFPTIANLSGSFINLPDSLDGIDISPIWSEGITERENPLFFHSPHYENNQNKRPRSAIVQGNYKLIVEYETGNTFLFDLDMDIGESNDISQNLPGLTYDLRLALRDHLLESNANMPSLNPEQYPGSGDDVDQDGLPDAWEFQYLLSHTFGPDDDPDQDGSTNLEEFNNDTDPYVSATTSIHDLNNSTQLYVYPNPATDKLLVKFPDANKTSNFRGMQIMNLQGQVLQDFPQYQEEIDLASYPSGYYLLKIKSGTQPIFKKFAIL